ncbi:hypothetical protein QBC47DRAFT_462129 [Echria macrotheca]|uniref:Uncharacterized protein n=1 Tax=Echria macrotheca TaxID=438768 RepID=A0AAJ0FAJ5_9PEZI|nr:hypothetical protein QBC47DRAFT_462129 [Echria macrotheca]
MGGLSVSGNNLAGHALDKNKKQSVSPKNVFELREMDEPGTPLGIVAATSLSVSAVQRSSEAQFHLIGVVLENAICPRDVISTAARTSEAQRNMDPEVTKHFSSQSSPIPHSADGRDVVDVKCIEKHADPGSEDVGGWLPHAISRKISYQMRKPHHIVPLVTETRPQQIPRRRWAAGKGSITPANAARDALQQLWEFGSSLRTL